MNLQLRVCQTLNTQRRYIHTVLLGPPELRKPFPQPLRQESPSAPTVSDSFMSLMTNNFNKTAAALTPEWGFTENGSPTFLSSGNPCLDFFFHVVPDTPSESLIRRLQAAWDHDPLTTLKLICNLRSVRGTGKSDREGFYTSAMWLHSHHPKTLACNVESFANFGYFKDLLEILAHLLEVSKVRKYQRTEEKRRNLEIRTDNVSEREKIAKEIGSTLRQEIRLAIAKKSVDRYIHDQDFRFLHDRVSECFAECLKNDMKLYEAGELKKFSLAAKWCPSLYSSYDLSTCICESIARKLFPRESYPEYQGIEDEHYAYRVRDRLRKQVLVPLRKALQLPEVYVSANQWDLLPYNRVASVAMNLYRESFMKRDKERFEKYLEDVKAGKKKIAAGALLPHEIIASLDEVGGEVAELQWKRMVDDLLREGKLKNSMAICDVSGSMTGIPMEVSVALGVLVSELSEDPWKGKLITFSNNPELQMVEGDDLLLKTRFVRHMKWGFNTDFQKVFEVILQVGVNGNLKPEQMIKRLFVFSDMEFDEASLNPWETDYQAIVRKFTEKGYGSAIPEIVFWNLRDSRATPVPAKQKGVALVSGFSKNLLKLFLNNDGTLCPEEAMEAAISGPEYQKLVVLD